MVAKNDAAPPNPSAARSYKQELDALYARRSAIDTLIKSLQNYDRFRVQIPVDSKRKMA